MEADSFGHLLCFLRAAVNCQYKLIRDPCPDVCGQELPVTARVEILINATAGGKPCTYQFVEVEDGQNITLAETCENNPCPGMETDCQACHVQTRFAIVHDVEEKQALGMCAVFVHSLPFAHVLQWFAPWGVAGNELKTAC